MLEKKVQMLGGGALPPSNLPAGRPSAGGKSSGASPFSATRGYLLLQNTMDYLFRSAITVTLRIYENVRYIRVSSPLSAELFSKGSNCKGFEFELGAPKIILKELEFELGGQNKYFKKV